MDTTEGKCACYCGAPNCSGEIGVKKQKEVKKAAGVKAPTAMTGWNLYKAEYCKEHKQAAPKDEVVEDKALRLAKSKQDREDARINWDAMAGEQQAVYNAKAESINKARQVQASKPKKRKPVLSSKAASQDDCWICRDGGETCAILRDCWHNLSAYIPLTIAMCYQGSCLSVTCALKLTIHIALVWMVCQRASGSVLPMLASHATKSHL